MSKFRSKTEKKRISHAKARAAERYQVVLTYQDLKSIVGKIRNREAEFIKKQSHTRTIYRVNYLDRDFLLVYSNVYREIITFLPNLEGENATL